MTPEVFHLKGVKNLRPNSHSGKPLIDNSPAPVRYRYLMIEAKAMNKAYVPFTSDSTMKKVVRYYDKHGSDNERMRNRVNRQKAIFFRLTGVDRILYYKSIKWFAQ